MEINWKGRECEEKNREEIQQEDNDGLPDI